MPLAVERKRAVAYKVTIADIVNGRYVVTEQAFSPNYVLTSLGLKLARVHVLGTAVNTYLAGDGRYAFLSVDDGTGVIRVKAFQDTKAIEKVQRGQLVDVIGRVREYNKERYIVPELIKMVTDPNAETLRRLEILRFSAHWKAKRKAVFEAKKSAATLEELKSKLAGSATKISEDEIESILETEQLEEEKAETSSDGTDSDRARSIILKAIQEVDKGEGADYSSIVRAAGLPEPVAEKALTELLSEGSAYEPRAGKIKIIA